MVCTRNDVASNAVAS